MKILRYLLLAFILLFQFNSYSQVEKYMSAFTYQICKSTTWPNPSSEFVIGVLGKSSLTPYFKQMTIDKKIGNSPISLVEWGSASEVGKCNILFISKDQIAQLSTVSEKLSGEPVLIFTESQGTIKNGASVCFSVVDNKIRYELNKTAILKNKLSVSGEVERMALKTY
jgi:hypothetical protein